MFILMSKTKRYSANYKKHIISRFSKAKNSLDRRKKCWINLFNKYSQAVLNKTEINIKTLMPEKNNADILELNTGSILTSKPNVLRNYSLSPRNLIRHSLKHKRNYLTTDSFLIKKNSSNLLSTSRNVTYTDRYNDYTSANTQFKNTEKVKDIREYRDDINTIYPTRVIWSISGTSLSIINLVSNKIINIKKVYEHPISESSTKSEDTNCTTKNIELQGSKKFFIQTQLFDSDSD
ncbi:hypothetical protein V1478_011341 [Vespula squamosa]|uniref:Uncharacterized protein n=1 Tax=Vespula squamosa TaxID=30214 RepID=A0ABD2AE75_VESSQ